MLAPINLDERFEREIKIPMTQQEFLNWEEEDIHAEWVDGEVTIYMPTSKQHQQIVGFLSSLLGLFARLFDLGEVLTAPYSMRAKPDGSVREPDVMFIAREHADKLKRMYLDAPADLVVEIISDTSVTRDRADKFYEYQESGVREYLIVDSRAGKERVDYYFLAEDGSYQAILADEEGKFHSRVLPGFWFRKEWLFQERTPDPLRALMEIAPEAVRKSVEGN